MASVSMKRWGITADHISMGELYLGMIFIEFKRKKDTNIGRKILKLIIQTLQFSKNSNKLQITFDCLKPYAQKNFFFQRKLSVLLDN